MTEHYHGSKGPVLIANMAYPHLLSARDKLIRDGFGKERAAEVEAMSARLEEIDAMADEKADEAAEALSPSNRAALDIDPSEIAF